MRRTKRVDELVGGERIMVGNNVVTVVDYKPAPAKLTRTTGVRQVYRPRRWLIFEGATGAPYQVAYYCDEVVTLARDEAE